MVTNTHILAEVQTWCSRPFARCRWWSLFLASARRSDARATLVASRSIRRGRYVNSDLSYALVRLTPLIVDGRSAWLSGRQILLFRLEFCISISRCGTFIPELWIFVPMTAVKCAPSTRFGAVAPCALPPHRALRSRARNPCGASIPTRSEQSILQRLALAAMFARLSPSRSIVLCYRSDPQVRQTDDRNGVPKAQSSG
jgi:hypothetical protein